MKLIVYTAIIGDIDKLWSVLPGCQDVQHIAFVDKLKTETGVWKGAPPVIMQRARVGMGPTWEQRVVEVEWGPRRTARHYKTLPHRYMPDADAWLWVDGTIRARMHPMALVQQYSGSLIAQKHWRRRCLYDEVVACIQLRKDSRKILEAQGKHYRQEGMPKRWGLIYTGVVIRYNTPAICELNELWWEQIQRWSVRDQVSLPYICWKLGVPWTRMPGESPLIGKDDFVFVKHEIAAVDEPNYLLNDNS